MKIQISEEATCGKIIIPKGEYTVALMSESSQITLVGGGKDYKVTATKRRSTSKTRVTTVSYYCGGGKIWSLVVSTPKNGEWVAMLEYKNSSGKK